jgi:hypothetical protein
MRNARVFISCGQRTKRETEIGKSVEDYFKSNKFETYFAERVHSSEALTENIFKFLRQSEYFVFIDFRREKINEEEFRGSLFVNQEIAIATFLKLEGIGFCEKGKKREGILDYHIYNEFPFEDGTEIIETLKKETKKWDINSVNELKIIYDPRSTSINITITDRPQQPLSDWYHLEIKNRNKSKHAFSCHAYVTRIKDLSGKEEFEIPTNELIWSGIGVVIVNIMGGTRRELDAFYIIHGENQIRFHQRPLTTTSPQYHLPDLPQGKYLIEYTIISSNFEKVSQSYILEFEGSVKDVVFKKAD